MPLLPRLAFVAVALFALVEVAAHAATLAAVAPVSDWRAAADFVRGRLGPADAIVAAPGWADPVLRQVLGDRIDAAMAGRSDLAAYERLWVLSIRGAAAPEAPDGAPELVRNFGGVRVQRWALGPSPVVVDLTEHVFEAEVELERGGTTRPCDLSERRPGRRGGLGFGVVPPARRFQCPDRRGNVWVAPVVMEDLSLKPRRCVYQHPARRGPVRVRFPELPLGDRIVVYAGIYYEHERMRQGAPVTLDVAIDGAPAGRMVHVDGDGWKRMTVDTGAFGERGEIAFEVTSPDPDKRIFCWHASVRRGQDSRP
ncbi:MAG: hypothetical protein PVI30_06905 [Myxococcales bacterium]